VIQSKSLMVAILATVATCSMAMASSVSVTPSNMGNWSLFTTDNANYGTPGGGSGTGTAAISAGPAGSGGGAELATGPGHGDESAQLRNATDWVGTNINDLTTLSYSTYATASNATPPSASQDSFFIMYLANGDRLFFEPIYGDGGDVVNPNGNQPAPVLNTLQSWDLLKGMWYSDNYGGPGSGALSWSAMLALENAAGSTTIVNAPAGLGGLRITVGEASTTDNFDVFIDNFSIGTETSTKTYVFGPDVGSPVPLPASAGMGLVMLAGLGAVFAFRKRMARKAQAI